MGRPPPGSAPWVRRLLAGRWGLDARHTLVRPLLVDGAPPLSHTAGLWRVRGPAGDHVLKVRLVPEALRTPEFYGLKEEIGAHCRRHGVPVAAAIPALDGTTTVRCDHTVCELTPWYPGRPADPADPAQSAAVVRCGVRLRRALDRLPASALDRLASVPLPLLVEEEEWRAALLDAERRLLPLSAGRADAFSRRAAAALRAAVAAGPLLHGSLGGLRAAEPAAIHSDLHPQHFIVAPRPGSTAPGGGTWEVLAVLDFDNLHTGDRRLDLAWLAETAGRVRGDTARRRALAAFLDGTAGTGLLGAGDEALLMPLLMAHSLPVVVDIAKDILERGDLSDQWPAYLELLSPERRAGVHDSLTAASRAR
ncbi:phosphotransferase [Streptomyces sp. NPDC001889]